MIKYAFVVDALELRIQELSQMVSGLWNDLAESEPIVGGTPMSEVELKTIPDEISAITVNPVQLVTTFEERLEAIEARNQYHDASFKEIEKQRAEPVNSGVTSGTMPIAQLVTTASDVSTNQTVRVARINGQPGEQISTMRTTSERQPSNDAVSVPLVNRCFGNLPCSNVPDAAQGSVTGQIANGPLTTLPITASKKKAKYDAQDQLVRTDCGLCR